VSRNVPGAFGRLGRRRALPWVIALVILSACSPAAITPHFSLTIRNAGDVPVRLKVLVAGESAPTRDLLIPRKSGILETEDRPMGVKDGKPDVVTVELYTDTCSLVTEVTVGEGVTRITIGEDLSLALSSGSANSDPVKPELVPAC
jgi:hypothetical protein